MVELSIPVDRDIAVQRQHFQCDELVTQLGRTGCLGLDPEYCRLRALHDFRLYGLCGDLSRILEMGTEEHFVVGSRSEPGRLHRVPRIGLSRSRSLRSADADSVELVGAVHASRRVRILIGFVDDVAGSSL